MTDSAQPLELRRRALLPARGMARYFSGGPFLLVSTRLAPQPGLGAETIFAEVGRDDIRFFFADDRADDLADAPQLPSDLLAIVATAADAAPLCALWAERGLEPPPLIVVESLTEAIGPVLACARREIAAVAARSAELQNALVTTRAEFEETRSAMQGVMRTLSHRYATKMNLVAAVAPAAAKTTIEASGATRSVYPVGTEGVTCLALHIDAPRLRAKSFLRVLLLGAESGRVLGEWRRPGDALLDGWNTFDLPTPLAAVRETLSVAVSLDGAPQEAVTLSLGDGEEEPLAIRIWTADAGGRFPHARHWMWSAQGAARPALGTATLVDNHTIACIARRGRIEAMREPVEGAAASYLLRGGASLLWLEGLSIRDAEGVCIELTRGLGDLRHTRFELVVRAGGQGLSSGWRSFQDGANALKLGLSLPAALPDIVDLFLRIEDGERKGREFAVVAIRHIEVIAGSRGDIGIGLEPMEIAPDALPPSEAGPAAHFAAIKAANYSETERFALFEVTLDGLAFDDRIENGVKFKASMSKGRLSLEFRQGGNWPRIFKQWPGREQDRFGDVFRVSEAGEELSVAGSLETDADRDLLAALCSLMPTIVAAGIQTLPSAAQRRADWLEAARAFAAASEQTFDGLGP